MFMQFKFQISNLKYILYRKVSIAADNYKNQILSEFTSQAILLTMKIGIYFSVNILLEIIQLPTVKLSKPKNLF